MGDIYMRETFPPEEVKPPKNSYPEWLAARMRGENVAIPESVVEEYRVKIEPWMREPGPPPKTFGYHGVVPEKYVPPPTVVQEKPKIPVTFKVLDSFDNPIFGFSFRVNNENLMTNTNGEASIEIYKGHKIDFSTGRESGWSLPKGARRKVRMVGMVPMSQIFPVNIPTTIFLFPVAGEYSIGGGRTLFQSITYTNS